jgi:DNA primase
MMERDESLVVDILVSMLGEPHAHYDNKYQISFDCPVCSHDIKGLSKGDGKGNLEINYSQHVFKCWACAETNGTQGHLGKLIDKWGSKKDKEMYNLIRPDDFEKKEKKYDKIKLPEGYQKFKDVHPVHIPRREAYNYLKSRGITDDMIEQYDIGFTTEGQFAGRIIIPSYDEKGELNYFIARSWSKSSKVKYKNPALPKETLIFNESRIDWNKDVWIVEGVFDGLFVPNSIPLLGKYVSDLLWEKLYDKCKGRIIICLDGDAWEDAKKIYYKLSGGRLYGKIDIIKLPLDKDLCDLRGQIPEGSQVVLEVL